MKKTLLVFLSLLACNVLIAGSIGKQLAQQKAVAFIGKNAPVKLVAVDKESQPSYYVFNVQSESKGFVIVSGEDSADGILGYAEHGVYDPQDAPPALQYMLDCYAQQVAMVREGLADRYQVETVYDEIAPLITTSWDQLPPYNKHNPINPTTGEAFKYAGCVATAMAQIVKYWASPVQVQDIPSYTYYLSDDGNSFSTSTSSGYPTFTVEALPATTFDFGIMEDTYSSKAEGESIDEVARLVAYCGRSIEMKYVNSGGVGATSAQAFAKYFGYNPNAFRVFREDYTAAEWDQLVYQELQSGRPVLYSGRAVSSYGESGHAFVCDGYKDGLFHLNWGWSGRYNGYFKLSECNPYGTGSGGSNSKDGYSVTQHAEVGIQPDAMEPQPDKIWMQTSDIYPTSTEVLRASSDENFEISIYSAVYSASSQTHTFDFGIGIYDGNDLISTNIWRSDRTYTTNYGMYGTYTFSWGEKITKGTYILRNISRESGTTEWTPNLYSDTKYLVLTVDGNTLTITKPGECLSVENVEIEGLKKEGKTLTLRSQITNNGLATSNKIYLYVDDKLTSGAGVNTDPGTTDEVLLHFVAPAAGTHSLAIYQVDKSGSNVGEALWTGSIDIAESPDPNLSASNCKIKNLNSTNRTITGNSFTMSIAIKNEDTQDFDDELTFRLFKLTDVENGIGTKDAEQTVLCYIPAGATQTLSVSFDDLLVNEKYWINTYYYKPSESAFIRIYKTKSYYIIGDETDIDTVSTATRDEDNSPCYNLNGQRINSPGKGIYIRNGKKYIVR